MDGFAKFYKWAIGVLVILTITGLAVLFLPKIRNIRELQRRKSALETENKNIEQQTKQLRLKREKFKTDPEFIERVARRSGRVKPNEVIFKFTDEDKTEVD
ncbi:MAG: septum formation initiator family protein [Kiritimatiellae bacterium]|nr:septum formation initiator family protein [Kiritimatiellia bacterium]